MEKLIEWGMQVIQGEKKPWVFRLALLLSCITLAPFALLLVRYGGSLVDNVKGVVLEIIDESLPDNFELSIKNGIVKTNQTEPFYVVVSEDKFSNLFNVFEEYGSDKESADIKKQKITKVRLLTIDTTAKVEDFARYQTAYLLNRNSFIYVKEGDINVSSLSGVADFVVTKPLIIDEINKYTGGNFKTWSTTIMWFLLFCGIILVTVMQIIIWYFQAVLIWLIGKIIGMKIGMWRATSLLVYLTGGADIITTLLSHIKSFDALYVTGVAQVWSVVIMTLGYYLLSLYKSRNKAYAK